MIYLILAMISSMLVSVLMRLSEEHCRGGMGMLAANYVMCCGLSLAFAGSIQFFPAADGLAPALLMGGVNGVLYLAGFVLLQWNIRKNGVVLPATFMKLGVLVPTILSILIFGEIPGLFQLIGILAFVGVTADAANKLLHNVYPPQDFSFSYSFFGASPLMIYI